jgi:hypothetical protein
MLWIAAEQFNGLMDFIRPCQLHDGSTFEEDHTRAALRDAELL